MAHATLTAASIQRLAEVASERAVFTSNAAAAQAHAILALVRLAQESGNGEVVLTGEDAALLLRHGTVPPSGAGG